MLEEMASSSAIKLGQSVSLLAGYNPTVYVERDGKTVVKSIPKPVLSEFEPKSSDDKDAKWDEYPTISLHHTVDELVSALQLIKLRPSTFEVGSLQGGIPAWPSGPLTVAGLSAEECSRAISALSLEIGVDLSKSGLSFALVRHTRKTGTAVYPSYQSGIFRNVDSVKVEPQALDALKKLEKKENSYEVTQPGANGYLDFYKEFGTHFISAVDFGDTLFQVFAYQQAEFQTILEIYGNKPDYLSGRNAQYFSQYTVKLNELHYGYTSAIGKLCIASGDPALSTSVKSGKWHDNRYAEDDSIFAPYLRSDSVDIKQIFHKIVTLGIELSSLSKFAEYYRMLDWQEVFKGAMYTRFANGVGVAPHFSNQCPYNISDTYKNSSVLGGDGLLSTIATPSVNFFQEHVILNSIMLTFPELVKYFGTFSSALEITLPADSQGSKQQVIDIPGSESVRLISHVVSVQGSSSLPPALRVQNAAYASIMTRIYCGEFYGGLRLINSDGSKSVVITNGLLYASAPGSSDVMVTDIRQSPSADLLNQSLSDFQLSLVSTEFRLNFLLSGSSTDEDKMLISRHLLWIGESVGQIPTTQASVDPLALKARALYLAKVAANPNNVGLLVPYLKYSAYKDAMSSIQNVIETASTKLTHFQTQIRARKAEEREIAREQQLNENIIKSGKLLSQYISDQADFQESFSSQYQSVIQIKQKEIDFITKQVAILKSKLEEQRMAVETEVEAYKDAVADWQKNQIISVALDIASNLFALGFAIAIPATAVTSLASLGTLVGRIQKAVKVFDAVITVYKSFKMLPKDPSKLISSLDDVNPQGLNVPSSLEWSELKVNMEATLDMGPQIGAKTKLKAAFDILVLRGQALVELQNMLQQKLSDLVAIYSNQRVHEDQVSRFRKLSVYFNIDPQKLDRSAVDLIGLSSQLVFFQHQMLGIMASTLEIQGRALQYEYLEPLTLVISFSFIDLQFGILQQAQSIHEGLVVQPMPQAQPEPIVYEVHGIHPESLINGSSYSFNILSNRREFSPYNYVRVNKVKAEIGGIASTKSGKYYVELKFDGDPFMDRGFNGKALTFQTISRLYTYLNQVLDSSHTKVLSKDAAASFKFPATTTYLPEFGVVAEDIFGENVSKITPFSSWTISLPPTATNEDIKFDNSSNGVTVRLIFQIYAQLKETGLSTEERVQRATALRTRSIHSSIYETLVATPSISNSDVLEKMRNKSVVYGCDVVFSMSVKQVNDNLLSQYNDRKNIPKFLRDTGRIEKDFTNSQGNKSKTIFDFKFNAVQLKFILNNSSYANVKFPILSGSSYEEQIFVKNEWIVFSKYKVKPTDQFSVDGQIPLAILQGSVSSQLNVSLKLNGGKFSSQNFKPGTDNPNMNDALDQYFTQDLPSGYEIYNLGTLDTKNVTLLKSLTPTKFNLNVYHTPSNRDILQLFIATTGQLQKEAALQLDEPFPTANESSLIISSEIFFDKVIPSSFSDAGVGLQLTGVKPSDNNNEWSAKVTNGSISGPFYATQVGKGTIYRPHIPGGCPPTIIEFKEYVAVRHDKVIVPLADKMLIKASDWGAQMSYFLMTKYDFLYGSKSLLYGRWSDINYKSYSLMVTITMGADLAFTVTGKGQNQELQLSPLAFTNPRIDGKVEPPAAPCHYNDHDLQQKFLSQLRSTLTNPLTTLLKKKIPAISLFALKNILFPAKNLIDLREVFIPADLVIFGNFTTDSA